MISSSTSFISWMALCKASLTVILIKVTLLVAPSCAGLWATNGVGAKNTFANQSVKDRFIFF